MLHLRHEVKEGRLISSWEPGLFAVPGVLLIWAFFIALHRMLAISYQGQKVIMGVALAFLLLGGLILSAGRAGIAFDRKQKKWAYWVGLFRPVLFWWRSLEVYDRVLVTADCDPAGGRVYALSLEGKKSLSLAISEEPAFIFSMAESLAFFLEKPLSLSMEGEKKQIQGPPYWQSLWSASGEEISEGKLSIPKHGISYGGSIKSLKGRGPLLLAAFMACVCFFTIKGENFLSTPIGGIAVALCGIMVTWGIVRGLADLMRRSSLRLEKEGILIEKSNLFGKKKSSPSIFPWKEIIFLSVVPARVGFLHLAGRDGGLFIADSEKSEVAATTLPSEKKLSLYASILAQVRRRN